MPELVYNVKFKIDPNVGTGDSAITVYKEQAEQLTVELEKAQEQLRLLKGGKGTGSFKGMGEDVKNVGKSFSTANQAIFSFSDGIQDAAQFSQGFSSGMRAVGNNIGFTFELMANLDRKVEEYNETNGAAITRLDALKQAIFQTDKEGNILRNSFGLMKLSATGFVLALNTAITVITMVSTALSNYSKKAKEAKDSTSEFTSAVKQYYDLASGSATQSRLEKDVEFYKRRVDVLDEAKKLQDELNTNVKASARTQGQYSNQLFIERKEIEQKISNNKELQDQLGIQIDDYDELTKNFSSATIKLKAFTNGTREAETEVGRYHRTIKDQANVSLDLFNTRIEGGTNAVFESIRAISELEKKYIQEIRTGKTELLPLLKDIISVRKDLLKATTSQFEMPDISLNYDIFDAAKKAQGQINLINAEGIEDREKRAEEVRRISLENLINEYSTKTHALEEYQLDVLKIENDYNNEIDAINKEKEDKRKKERELILEFKTRQVAKGRDDEASITAYYDQKLIEESQKLTDQQITNQEVFSELSKAIEAERVNEINKLQEDAAKKTVDIEKWKADTLMQVNADLIMATMGLFSSAFQNNKAIAIAETLVSTYFSAQKAYQSVINSPQALALGVAAEPLARRAAAAAVIQGLARVAAIASTEIGSGTGSGVGTSGGGGSYSLRTASGFRGETGFNVSGEGPSYTPTMFGPKSFIPQATINLNVDETGFALYLQGIEGKLANDTMAIQSV